MASGRVRIYKASPSGKEVLVVEGPGASIAELPVFDGGNYPASAAEVEPAKLLFVSRKDFRNVCLEHPEVALMVLQIVGGRLRRLLIIGELSLTTVRYRLISWLLRQAKTEGDRGPSSSSAQVNRNLRRKSEWYANSFLPTWRVCRRRTLSASAAGKLQSSTRRNSRPI